MTLSNFLVVFIFFLLVLCPILVSIFHSLFSITAKNIRQVFSFVNSMLRVSTNKKNVLWSVDILPGRNILNIIYHKMATQTANNFCVNHFF